MNDIIPTIQSAKMTERGAEITIDGDKLSTIVSLKNVIERNLSRLKELKKDKKNITEQEVSLLDNDPAYTAAVDAAEAHVRAIKEHKARVKATPQSTQLKVKKQDIAEQEKEINEALSNHLTNYFQITGSKVFDTSSGKQLEFKVKASISSKQLSLFE